MVCCGVVRVIFLALEELFKRRQARLAVNQAKDKAVAAKAQQSSSTAKGEKETNAGEGETDPSPPSNPPPHHLLSTHVDAQVDQQVLTVKGYHSLPSTSLLLNADGLIEDVYLFGLPVELDIPRWMRVRAMCSGRLVNGYCADDWLLRWVYGAASITNNISGLRPVTVDMEERTRKEGEEGEGVELGRKQAETQLTVEEHKKNTPPRDGGSEELSDDGELGLEGRGELKETLGEDGDVDGLGIDNHNLTGKVNGHMDYPKKIQEILQAIHFHP